MAGTGSGEQEWVSVAEAARRLQLTPAAISYYIRKDRLRSKRAGARSVLVPWDEVNELFAKSPRRLKSSLAASDEATTAGVDEVAAVRAELKAVRAHLVDVQKERDHLMALLEARARPA